jgi:hypothetical protein
VQLSGGDRRARIIYGVNYHSDNVTELCGRGGVRADEAVARASYGFEIGNEIDNRYGAWSNAPDAVGIHRDGGSVATPGAASLVGPAGGRWGFTRRCPFRLPRPNRRSSASKLVLLTEHYYTPAPRTRRARRWPTLQTPDRPNHAPYIAGRAHRYGRDGERRRRQVPHPRRVPPRRGATPSPVTVRWESATRSSPASGSLDYDVREPPSTAAAGSTLHGGETGMDGSRPFYYEPIMENRRHRGGDGHAGLLQHAPLLPRRTQARWCSVRPSRAATPTSRRIHLDYKAAGFDERGARQQERRDRRPSATVNLRGRP